MDQRFLRLTVTSLLAGWLAAGAVYAGPVRVIVPSEATVDGELLRLGDFARVEPPLPQLVGLKLGYIPGPGEQRILQRDTLLLTLQAVEPEVVLEMDRVAAIRSRTIRLQESDFRAAVEGYLAREFPEAVFTLTDFEAPQDVAVPAGAVKFRIGKPPASTRLERASFRVNVLVDHQPFRSYWIYASLSAQVQAVVLQRDLEPGVVIRADDVALQTCAIADLGAYFRRPQAVLGQAARRSLSAGHTLRPQDLTSPQLVRRGDLIKLIVRGPRFSISTLAKAGEPGAKGDLIEVMNLDSKQRLQAEVIGAKRAAVWIGGSTE